MKAAGPAEDSSGESMRQSARVIVFNGDEAYKATLRSDLLRISGLQIVAELEEIALLQNAVAQFAAEAVVVHLDPAPETVLPVAAQIAQSHPNLSVIVITESTDGQHVLTALRAGIKEFLTKPVDAASLANAFSKIVAQSGSTVELGTLISVVGTVGGVGASMLAVNLASELGQLASKRPVAVVDLDFRYGQLGTMLDLQADYTIADLCDTPEQLDAAVINKVMVKHSSGLHLLARPNAFAQADQITAAHCSAVLSALQQMYEYVVVDGPNRFDTGGSVVIDMSDVTLVAVQLLVTSVRNVHRMMEELRGAGYNMERFRLVCNRVGLESSHLAIEHVEHTLGRKIDYQVPDDWKAVSSAINMGIPLLEAAPKSRVRGAIQDIARSIAAPDTTGKPAAQAGRSGLLGRIFSGTS